MAKSRKNRPNFSALRGDEINALMAEYPYREPFDLEIGAFFAQRDKAERFFRSMSVEFISSGSKMWFKHERDAVLFRMRAYE